MLRSLAVEAPLLASGAAHDEFPGGDADHLRFDPREFPERSFAFGRDRRFRFRAEAHDDLLKLVDILKAQEAGEAPPAPAPPAPAPSVPDPAVLPQVQIHLAAGMAIVVDGSLDLKGHARSDAEERLKERILDGYALGWRTLHVVVGTSADLRQMVLDLLMSPAGRCVARYAQAPVPMGGAQAWILYFRGPGTPEN